MAGQAQSPSKGFLGRVIGLHSDGLTDVAQIVDWQAGPWLSVVGPEW